MSETPSPDELAAFPLDLLAAGEAVETPSLTTTQQITLTALQHALCLTLRDFVLVHDVPPAMAMQALETLVALLREAERSP
jgi:hypothetical protein